MGPGRPAPAARPAGGGRRGRAGGDRGRGGGPGWTAAVRECRWTSTFRTHRRLAAHDGRRRVLLIGDAAHVCSPIGGQGLNLGLRDAVSLASALPAATARGGPVDTRLAAWRRTRRADALGVLARTDLATRTWTLRSAPARAVRDTAVRGALTTAAGRRLLAGAVAGPRPG
ncbi:FAD-dependent oxidoreductase [Streptomyces virginiae]